MLRLVVLAGATYLGQARWVETEAEMHERIQLIAEVVMLEEQTRSQFEANVGMPESGKLNRMWDAVGEKIAKMLRERKLVNHEVKQKLKLAAAIQSARGLKG